MKEELGYQRWDEYDHEATREGGDDEQDDSSKEVGVAFGLG